MEMISFSVSLAICGLVFALGVALFDQARRLNSSEFLLSLSVVVLMIFPLCFGASL